MRIQSKQYAEWVASQASRTAADPLYTGEHLKDVAEYVNLPLKRQPRATSYFSPPVSPFAHLYNIDAGLGKLKQFTNAFDFEDACERHPHGVWHNAGLLFLTGHATPEWLNAVGGEFHIDPLHLVELLGYRATVRPSTFAFPSIPSASGTIIYLAIPTIGHVEPRKPRVSSTHMQKLRRQCTESLRQTARTLESVVAPGAAVLKRFYLHDFNTFTIEQDITVSIVHNGSRWTVLISCDCSGDGECPDPPLHDIEGYERSQFMLTPVVQLKRGRQTSDNAEIFRRTTLIRPQSLAMLPGNYGQMLDCQLAAQDPFYALYELMNFAASAEAQWVNLMEQHLNEQVELAGHDQYDAPSLADFQHVSEILESRIARLKRLLSILDNRNNLDWPQCDNADLQIGANESIAELERDFNYLLNQLLLLLKKSERGKDVVMGNTNTVIAQRALLHNQTLGRLTSMGTWVAMLYVPLSFLTTIFGMNFREFNSGHLSIWIWATASTAVLLICLATFLYWRRIWLSDRLNVIKNWLVLR
ncbi:hypothetical protein LTR37_005069 [Vermiconidia calcicola]|uniref:Uncharacterized protein n=1 Tax=Vermiconidia calcicola TaxID=1690605 RepID=A0ACC3NLF6_9PEZI|nr:hypothetical protein LTR37_005069 [Vermiconidia calcicola]